MAYSPQHTIYTYSGGDTVRSAFEKYNSEVVKIYGILNTLNDNDLSEAELATLKTGSIAGSRITGTISSGYIDGSHVTGTLTNATIPYGNVTSLQTFVKDLIQQNSGSGSGTDSGGGITDQQLGAARGYVKFSTGFMLQYGIAAQTSNGTVNFRTEFPSACYLVVGSAYMSTEGVPSRDLEYDSFTIYGWDKTSFRFTANANGSVGCTYIALGA